MEPVLTDYESEEGRGADELIRTAAHALRHIRYSRR